VTAAVVAARQVFIKLRQASIAVISPSDMRALLGAGEDVAPLAGGATMTMEPPTQPADFWQTARLVRREAGFGALTLEAIWGPYILLGYEGER
jgi:hypothetical protein